MTDITSIPLNKLVVSDDNVRRTAGADTAPNELPSSIAAQPKNKLRQTRLLGNAELAAAYGVRSSLTHDSDYGKVPKISIWQCCIEWRL
jgi:hypothetical protein